LLSSFLFLFPPLSSFFSAILTPLPLKKEDPLSLYLSLSLSLSLTRAPLSLSLSLVLLLSDAASLSLFALSIAKLKEDDFVGAKSKLDLLRSKKILSL
jgi:hypothetical protein